ncbi:VTT domain-containing protein [Microbacterium kribbense]|uniref:VTT domain-containing protein n=1 Tax=Microbacterium kribbense TaxID=433645 RepID=A0ABP7H1D3_9MICO
MDITSLLSSVGLPTLLVLTVVIVFIENGLLFPFLPGDSLVFAAALLAAGLGVGWPVIALAAAVGAVLGAELGFTIGRRYGRRLFTPEARVFKTDHLDRADRFFARWGAAAIVLGRFVPVVRTYISPAIGASSSPRRTFSVWNAVGAVIWAGVLALAGDLLGQIPFIAANIELIALVVVVASVLPFVITAAVRRLRPGRRVTAAGEPAAAEPKTSSTTR